MSKLPEQFADMEQKFGEWILPVEAERANMRVSKSNEELAEFYEAVQPHVLEYVGYLRQFELDQLPEQAINLWHFVCSYIGVAAAIEMYGTIDRIPGVELIGQFRPVGMKNEHALLV